MTKKIKIRVCRTSQNLIFALIFDKKCVKKCDFPDFPQRLADLGRTAYICEETFEIRFT